MFPESLQPGDIVCDCRYQHRAVASVDLKNDYVVLEDGFTCSAYHCLHPVPHPDYEHPSDEELAEFYQQYPREDT
jgi:hypothetical protein